MHLLPRDEMRPDRERTLQPPAAGWPGEPDDPSGLRARLERGRLGTMRSLGWIIFVAAHITYLCTHAAWALYAGVAGTALLVSAYAGALIARYAPTVRR